jgi:hypothetical protein
MTKLTTIEEEDHESQEQEQEGAKENAAKATKRPYGRQEDW